jgi:putative transcriptional regulator
MEERGLDQKTIVDISGINRNTIKALANNANNRIDFPTLDKLCRSLNVVPGDLIEYIDEGDEGLKDSEGTLSSIRESKMDAEGFIVVGPTGAGKREIIQALLKGGVRLEE